MTIIPRRALSGLAAIALMIVYLAIVVPSAQAAPKCFGRDATIVGTPGDDDLTGTSGSDVIVARGGNDLIDAGGGRDFICAGPGFDDVFAGPGNDRVKGGGAVDFIWGGPGHDFINGQGGLGDHANYEFAPGGIVANLMTNTVIGEGTDRLRNIQGIHGTPFDDVIIGDHGVFNDLTGWGGDDVLVGLGGDDAFWPGAGDDLMDGGPNGMFGDEVHYDLDFVGDEIVLSADPVEVNLATEQATGQGADVVRRIESAFGSMGDDTLIGTDVHEGLFQILFSGAGDDTLMGAGGTDILGPGSGDDTVDGGDGADDLVIFDLVDLDDPFGPGGVDVDLQAGTATGHGTDTLMNLEGVRGSFFADVIRGTDADDILFGIADSDALEGRAGDDFLDGDDTFFGESELGGEDTLDGGDDVDICLNGETNLNCEVEARPAAPKRPALRAMGRAYRALVEAHMAFLHTHL